MKDLILETRNGVIEVAPFDHDNEVRIIADGGDLYLSPNQVHQLITYLQQQLQEVKKNHEPR